MGKLRDYLPALRYGNKIHPEDLAGMIGLPYIGNVYYVDGTNGNDTANNGKSGSQAFKSASAAHAATTTLKHDVVVVIAGGTAAGAAANETSAVTWSNSYTHLVGAAAGNVVAGRARIVASANALSPFVTFSGNGNIISNVQIYNGQTTGLYDVKVTGDRNAFSNVHFAGIADATAGDSAAAAALWLSGSDENLFSHCVIGVDTAARSTSNAELEVSDSSTRNIFEDSYFLSYADNAGHFFVKVDAAADIDRFLIFNGCTFLNATKSAATAMTAAFSVHAAAGGTILLKNCTLFGATDWEATGESGNTVIDGAAPTNNTSGIAINVETT